MSSHHLAITHLLHSYAERIDLGDFEGVAQLFAHAEIKAPDNQSGARGYDQVLAMYRNSTRLYPDNNTPHTKHVISNSIIDIDESNSSAQARSYFTVYQSLADFPLQAIIAGRYHDTFSIIDNQWHFTERLMLPELLGDLSRHLLFDSSSLQT